MFFVSFNGFAEKNAAIPQLQSREPAELGQDLEGRGVRPHRWPTESGPSNLGQHPHLQKFPGAEVRNQSK